MREVGEALIGLSVVPIALAVFSLRNHSGWAFELDGGQESLRGIRVRGGAVLLGAVMIALGNALSAETLLPVQWLLLAATLVLSLGFVGYAPAFRSHGHFSMESGHRAPQAKLTTASKTRWLLMFVGALVCAAILWLWQLG